MIFSARINRYEKKKLNFSALIKKPPQKAFLIKRIANPQLLFLRILMKLSMNKSISLLFSAILVTSSLMVISASSEITKPSVPEFTLRYVDNSYDVPPIYSVDPYTGKNVLTQAGYYVENKSIEVIIKNQPFLSYRNENNSIVELHYYILAKGHFQDWNSDLPNPDSRVDRSDGEYTVVTYGLGRNNGSDVYHRQLGDVSAWGKVDFKVQALLGYSARFSRGPYESQFGEAYYYVFTVVGKSDWSIIQTISIPDGVISISTSPNSTASLTATSSQNPTATFQQSDLQNEFLFGLDWSQIAIILLGITVAVLAFALVFSHRRSAKRSVNSQAPSNL
jgi:hypothetical protein